MDMKNKISDCVCWNGENKELVYNFIMRHSITMGIPKGEFIKLDYIDSDIVVKNINLTIRRGQFLIITKRKHHFKVCDELY